MDSKVVLTLLVTILACGQCSSQYEVDAKRVSLATMPLLSSLEGRSSLTYNYNPSYLPIFKEDGSALDGLIVRCQNATAEPYGVGPSVMAYSKSTSMDGSFDINHLEMSDIHNDNVIFSSEGEAESYGVEDPRVAYREENDTYYLFYSAVQEYPDKVVSRLSMATTQTPLTRSSWQRHGPVFPSASWSKSGAMLFRDDVQDSPHYLLWGDNNITIAEVSRDMSSFTNLHQIITIRDDHFDSMLVESGPPPLRLSDGNYFFIYNSARAHESTKPGYAAQYNPGWVILSGEDPTVVLQRSEVPMISPETSWEIGQGYPKELDLTPNVVFIEAAKMIGKDRFLVFYGAADSVLGAAEIEVHVDGKSHGFLEQYHVELA